MMYIFALIACVTFAKDSRKEEFDRIKKYELVHFDLSQLSESNLVSFDAFGNHYEVSLVRNEFMNPSTIHHTNGNLGLKEGLEPFYTHLTESCHFHGQVLGTNSSSVAISICDKRGIRGSISAFGYTLNIKPAKYFDAEFDRNNYHQHTDEHLVYKQSDFDSSGLRLPAEPFQTPHGQLVKSDNASKRRLAYNNGNNVLEVYSFVDPVLVSTFQRKYAATNWYDELVAYLADVFNAASEQYSNPQFCECPEERCPTDAGDRICNSEPWSDDLDGITVNLVALEVATNWNGIYQELKPDTHSDPSGLVIRDAGAYLKRFREWVKDYYFSGSNRPPWDTAYVCDI